MGFPAARLGDPHVCPMTTGPVPHVGGPLLVGAANVLVCNVPAANVGTTCVCCGPADVVVRGSSSVMIGGMPAARMLDQTAHGGVIVMGAPNVLIGG